LVQGALAFISTNNGHWRLVDVEEIELFETVRKDILKTNCVKKILSLFDRLVQGEEIDFNLWHYLKDMFIFLNNDRLHKDNLKDFEVFSVLRMLQVLGYGINLGNESKIDLNEINKRRPFWINLINKTLAETQL